MAPAIQPSRRLVICADGTWCHPDGTSRIGLPTKNTTNVYRLFASIQPGEVTNSEGKSYFQETRYIPGIGSEDGISVVKRVTEGLFGFACSSHIRDIYRDCCRLTGPEDEIWLYGFSRGAYTVRAVAGLLHYLQALKSADKSDKEFNRDFEEALKVFRGMRQNKSLGEGRLHHMLHSATRPAATIRLVGVFDTVKAVKDHNDFDLSLNESIQNFRHALALNETRAAMLPEYEFPQLPANRNSEKLRFVQAWFIGAHIDIGGSSARDGLSLYPLQWMLVESQKLGLLLGFSGSTGNGSGMQNPISLLGLDSDAKRHTFTTENKIPFEVADIRQVHSGNKYIIHINRSRGTFLKHKARTPFGDKGDLDGYCEWSITLDMKEFPFYSHLQSWRYKALGYHEQIPVQGFWNTYPPQEEEELGPLRILVCGNAGVGKSTLINRVFGVSPGDEEITETSERVRGEHNVSEEIRWKGRPDLVMHDSRGFETGGVKEFKLLEDFIKNKSKDFEIDKRLHAIWICFEVNNSRIVQHSTERLFQVVGQYAPDVPIMVIATKKDDFEGIKEKEKKTQCAEDGTKATEEMKEAYAAEELQIRMKKIEEEILAVDGGRFDLCMAVSKNDKESIAQLTKLTAECFSSDRIRLLYIRAQVVRLDLKVDLAIVAAMRVYKSVLYSSTFMAGVPLGGTTNRLSSATNLCQAIVSCFGVETPSKETMLEVYKSNVVDDIGNSVLTAVAEGTSVMYLVASVLSGGMPLFLIPMVSNIPLVVPTTARLLLMLACDMILILSKAYQQSSTRCRTGPDVNDVRKAASAYRTDSPLVHAKVKSLIPKMARGLMRCYRIDRVEKGVKDIIADFLTPIVGGIGQPELAFRKSGGTPRASISSSMADSDGSIEDDMKMFKETRQTVEGHSRG